MQARRQFVIMPAKFNDKAVEIIMLWFKNLMVYRLSREISLRAEEMEKQLASMAFTPCGSQDMAKMGWVPPMVRVTLPAVVQIAAMRQQMLNKGGDFF